MVRLIKRERGMGRGKMLPDELQHQQLVEIRIQQRTRDGIEFPVMVVRAPGEVDNHNDFNFTSTTAMRSPHRLDRPRLIFNSAAIPRDSSGSSGMAPACEATHATPAVPCLVQRGQLAPRSR